ncbi:hypothetical protein HMPREF9074_07546 [Capnocytophaga sp. oral taxon 329 str. F0087]|nr:hypothetical protein HMPREF9074_07546 [Capnocytophaga sp. oral taxon 329 str. F0087]
MSICQFANLRNLQGFVVFVVNLITKVLRSSYTQSILNIYLIYTQDMIAVFLIKREIIDNLTNQLIGISKKYNFNFYLYC